MTRNAHRTRACVIGVLLYTYAHTRSAVVVESIHHSMSERRPTRGSRGISGSGKQCIHTTHVCVFPTINGDGSTTDTHVHTNTM